MTRCCCDLCGAPLPGGGSWTDGVATLELSGCFASLDWLGLPHKIKRRELHYCSGERDEDSCLSRVLAAMEAASIAAIPVATAEQAAALRPAR